MHIIALIGRGWELTMANRYSSCGMFRHVVPPRMKEYDFCRILDNVYLTLITHARHDYYMVSNFGNIAWVTTHPIHINLSTEVNQAKLAIMNTDLCLWTFTVTSYLLLHYANYNHTHATCSCNCCCHMEYINLNASRVWRMLSRQKKQNCFIMRTLAYCTHDIVYHVHQAWPAMKLLGFSFYPLSDDSVSTFLDYLEFLQRI